MESFQAGTQGKELRWSLKTLPWNKGTEDLERTFQMEFKGRVPKRGARLGEKSLKIQRGREPINEHMKESDLKHGKRPSEKVRLIVAHVLAGLGIMTISTIQMRASQGLRCPEHTEESCLGGEEASAIDSAWLLSLLTNVKNKRKPFPNN